MLIQFIYFYSIDDRGQLSRDNSQRSVEFSNGDQLISSPVHSKPEQTTQNSTNGPTERKDPPTTNFFDTLNWEEENAPLALESDDDDDEINSDLPNFTPNTAQPKREDSMDDEFAAFTSARTTQEVNLAESTQGNISVQKSGSSSGLSTPLFDADFGMSSAPSVTKQEDVIDLLGMGGNSSDQTQQQQSTLEPVSSGTNLNLMDDMMSTQSSEQSSLDLLSGLTELKPTQANQNANGSESNSTSSGFDLFGGSTETTEPIEPVSSTFKGFDPFQNMPGTTNQPAMGTGMNGAKKPDVLFGAFNTGTTSKLKYWFCFI